MAGNARILAQNTVRLVEEVCTLESQLERGPVEAVRASRTDVGQALFLVGWYRQIALDAIYELRRAMLRGER